MDNSANEEALDHLASLEQLDRALVVVGFKGWLLFAFFAALVVAIGCWSFFGTLPITVSGKCLIIDSRNEYEIRGPNEGTVKEIRYFGGQRVQKGEPIVIYENPDFQVVAPGDGEVLWVNARRGMPANSQESVVAFQVAGSIKDLQIIGFLPFASAQEIKVGMNALVGVDKASPEKYGMIRARVTEIFPFPVGPNEHTLRKIPSKELLNYLLGDTKVPKLLVISEPIVNPDNPSRLEWTSEKGPPYMIFPGAVGEVQVTLENIRPIDYVVPKS